MNLIFLVLLKAMVRVIFSASGTSKVPINVLKGLANEIVITIPLGNVSLVHLYLARLQRLIIPAINMHGPALLDCT